MFPKTVSAGCRNKGSSKGWDWAREVRVKSRLRVEEGRRKGHSAERFSRVVGGIILETRTFWGQRRTAWEEGGGQQQRILRMCVGARKTPAKELGETAGPERIVYVCFILEIRLTIKNRCDGFFFSAQINSRRRRRRRARPHPRIQSTTV